MNCLTCNNELLFMCGSTFGDCEMYTKTLSNNTEHICDDWNGMHDDIKSAWASNLCNNSKHKAYLCNNCYTIHIYCDDCNGWIKLVERSICMEGYNKCTLVSWRDENGEYHSIDVEDIYNKKCEDVAKDLSNEIDSYSKEFIFKYIIGFGKQDFTAYQNDFGEFKKKHGEFAKLKFKTKYGKSKSELYEEIFEEIVNNFDKTHTFKLDDLEIYCLNPNDLRLVTDSEKGLGTIGIGFNIEERAWAKWSCQHGETTIEGHDD